VKWYVKNGGFFEKGGLGKASSQTKEKKGQKEKKKSGGESNSNPFKEAFPMATPDFPRNPVEKSNNSED